MNALRSIEAPLSILLGPGIIATVFDGIERPLEKLANQTGHFLLRGSNAEAIDVNKKWYFKPTIKVGDKVKLHTILGEVKEFIP